MSDFAKNLLAKAFEEAAESPERADSIVAALSVSAGALAAATRLSTSQSNSELMAQVLDQICKDIIERLPNVIWDTSSYEGALMLEMKLSFDDDFDSLKIVHKKHVN